MFSHGADVEASFAAAGWTCNEPRKRPLPSKARTIGRAASTGCLRPTGAALRTAGLSSATGGNSRGSTAGRSAETEPPKSTPEVGSAVRLEGLVGAAHLNGSLGTCEEWDAESCRWKVRLENGEVKAVRPENLLVTCPATGSTAGSPERTGSRGSTADRASTRCQERPGVEVELQQKQHCTFMSLPHRRRRVEETLHAVRTNFDPAEGLAAAAAAAAEEILSRTEQQQQERSEVLAQPRAAPAEPSEEKPQGPMRSKAEQQARCEELAQPRRPPTPASASAGLDTTTPPRAEGAQAPCPPVARSAAAQRRRCAELSQPKFGEDPWDVDDGDGNAPRLNVAASLLAAKASQPVPEDVAAARELLAQMHWNALSHSRGERAKQRAVSEPPSPSAGGKSNVPLDSEAYRELRSVVEELLWVVLLQLRCVPKTSTQVQGVPGNTSTDSGWSKTAGSGSELEERLGNLLISTVGPVLRPVARRVLGPGVGVVRRIRVEFPRLALHLGFRESEDKQPVALAWSEEEVHQRANEVRACRDQMLSTDLTKTLMARLGQ